MGLHHKKECVAQVQDILNLEQNLNPIIGSKVTAIFQLSVKFHPNGSANGGATPSRNRSDFSLRITVRVKRFESPGHLNKSLTRPLKFTLFVIQMGYSQRKGDRQKKIN